MHRWLEHVGEAELEVESGSEEDVFVDALKGLAELLGEDVEGGASSTQPVVVRAPNRASLLVGWLEELLWVAERDGVVPEAVEAIELDGEELRAEVRLRDGPPRPLVKAVTWHELCFEPVAAGFRARVVFDV